MVDAGGVVALRDATFEVAKGEIFVIMGLSGSGKSTLLRCLTGLYGCTRGTISIDGTDLTRLSRPELIALRRRKISMVFQNFALLPHLCALDNIAFPLRVQGEATKTRLEAARSAMHLVGLAGKEGFMPHQLSGGQQQRVGIARSLVTKPDIWFLDEPFSALDPLIRVEMQDEFLRLQAQLHKTIVFVTHDLDEAVRLADRVAVMADGRILQIGTPEELALHPVGDYVRRFMGALAREKVIRVGSIIEPIGNDLSARTIRATDVLADVLHDLMVSDHPLPVADSSGALVGQLSRQGAGKWLA
jgi:glycine betaine/proline transport system ATP-binding protein